MKWNNFNSVSSIQKESTWKKLFLEDILHLECHQGKILWWTTSNKRNLGKVFPVWCPPNILDGSMDGRKNCCVLCHEKAALMWKCLQQDRTHRQVHTVKEESHKHTPTLKSFSFYSHSSPMRHWLSPSFRKIFRLSREARLVTEIIWSKDCKLIDVDL